MEAISYPTYALVGQQTMENMMFSNGSSWKWGFLVNPSQRLTNSKVIMNNSTKKWQKGTCANAQPALNRPEWTIATNSSIATFDNAKTLATNWIVLPFQRNELAVHIYTTGEMRTGEESAQWHHHNDTIPSKTYEHNNGHLH